MSEERIAQMLSQQLDSQTSDIQGSGSFVEQLNSFRGAQPPSEQNISIKPAKEAMGDVLSTSPVAMLRPGNPQERMEFAKSAIPKALQKLGIDDKGLALNKLGKLQLMGRFRTKFGDNFERNPQILDALNMFDSYLTKNDAGIESLLTKGERTLNAIYGGRK